MLTDLHSHRSTPYPQGVVSCSITADFTPTLLSARQYWSVGIHPWESGAANLQERLLALESAARLEQVVAIGEAGIDLTEGRNTASLFEQMELLRYHAMTAEAVGKPLVIHAVKAHVQIIGMHKQMHPRLPWIIHGFRSKPTIAKMYTDEGILLSYGERFNAESLRITPPDMRFAETDESPLPIERIIKAQATALGIDDEAYTFRLTANMSHIGITRR